jgi:predicted branched-subunit amino acid permease
VSGHEAAVTRAQRRTQIGSIAVVNALVAATVAATAVDFGMDVAMAAALTITMFAGAAQFAAMATVAASGAALAGWVAAMLVNARFLILGAGVSRRLNLSRRAKLLAAGALVDPIALLVHQEEPGARATRTYVLGGACTFLGWTSGALVGALGVTGLQDPERIGLDVALPALLLAILGSGMRDRDHFLAAAGGAGLGALLLLLALPTGAVILVSGAGATLPVMARLLGRPLRGQRGAS